eukprot:6182271-Pleurochrysis_carterae.AAC.1
MFDGAFAGGDSSVDITPLSLRPVVSRTLPLLCPDTYGIEYVSHLYPIYDLVLLLPTVSTTLGTLIKLSGNLRFSHCLPRYHCCFHSFWNAHRNHAYAAECAAPACCRTPTCSLAFTVSRPRYVVSLQLNFTNAIEQMRLSNSVQTDACEQDLASERL